MAPQSSWSTRKFVDWITARPRDGSRLCKPDKPLADDERDHEFATFGVR
jgi:hypothetical protein